MLLQTQTGPQTNSSGAYPNIRSGLQGDTIVSELHGRYYEAAYRKSLFFSFSSAQTLSLVGTAMTGNIIYNGNTSVNLVLQKIFLQVSVTSATMTGIALASNQQSTAPTGLTVATRSGSSMLYVAQSQGLAYNAATVAIAPTSLIPLMHNAAAIATTGVDQLVIDLEGSIIIPPNTVICLAALGAASAASAVSSSILWEEVPV